MKISVAYKRIKHSLLTITEIALHPSKNKIINDLH